MKQKITHHSECSVCRGTGKIPDSKKMGPILKAERIKADVAQNQVAKLLNVKPSFLCDLEKGFRTWTGDLVVRFRDAVEMLK